MKSSDVFYALCVCWIFAVPIIHYIVLAFINDYFKKNIKDDFIETEGVVIDIFSSKYRPPNSRFYRHKSRYITRYLVEFEVEGFKYIASVGASGIFGFLPYKMGTVGRGFKATNRRGTRRISSRVKVGSILRVGYHKDDPLLYYVDYIDE